MTEREAASRFAVGDRVQWHHKGRVWRGTITLRCLGDMDLRVCVRDDDGQHKHIGTHWTLERIFTGGVTP